MSNAEYILTELLNCGSADIKMLDEINYDFEDIKNEIFSFQDNIDFSSILLGAICLYQQHIGQSIDEKISELEYEIKDIEQLNDETQKIEEEDKIKLDRLYQEKEDLESLNAFDDIEYFINFLDTHIYITDENKRKLYKKYLNDEIDTENTEIGFVELDLD